VNLRRVTRGWLLWLALLLPIAQAMAGVHALSHVGDRLDDSIVHLVDCDLCLTAAHLAGGAPVAAPASLPAGPATHAVPQPAQAAVPHAVSHGLPLARGPPASA
jgi:hypothetical protein